MATPTKCNTCGKVITGKIYRTDFEDAEILECVKCYSADMGDEPDEDIPDEDTYDRDDELFHRDDDDDGGDPYEGDRTPRCSSPF